METSPATAAVSSSRGKRGKKTRKEHKKFPKDTAIIYNGSHSVHIITNPTKLFSSEPAGLKEQLDLAEQIIAVNEDLIKVQKKIIKGMEEQEKMGFETEQAASQLWSMKQLAAKTMYKSSKAETELRSLMDSLKIEDKEETSGDEIPGTNTEEIDLEVAAQSNKVKEVVKKPARRYARAKRQSKGHAKNLTK